MGSIFKKPKVPEIKPVAPPVVNPTPEVKDPELGMGQSPELDMGQSPEQRRKKGKSALKIGLNASASGGSGANIV